jgi:hypothetical protein
MTSPQRHKNSSILSFKTFSCCFSSSFEILSFFFLVIFCSLFLLNFSIILSTSMFCLFFLLMLYTIFQFFFLSIFPCWFFLSSFVEFDASLHPCQHMSSRNAVLSSFYCHFTSTQHPFFRFSILRTFILSIFFASRVSRKTFQRPFLPFQPKSLNLSLVLTFDCWIFRLKICSFFSSDITKKRQSRRTRSLQKKMKKAISDLFNEIK